MVHRVGVRTENLHQIAMDHQAEDPLHRVVVNAVVVMRVPLEYHYWSEMWLPL